jgi:hypothetical protein
MAPNTFTTASIMPSTSSLFVGPRCTGKTTAMLDVVRRIRDNYDYVIGITDEAEFGIKIAEHNNCLNFSPSGIEAVIDMIQHAGKDTSFLLLFCCSPSPINKAHLQTLFFGTAPPLKCTLLIEAQTKLPEGVRAQQDFVFAFNGAHGGVQEPFFRFMSKKKFEYKMRKYVPKYSALVADTENKLYYVYTPQV